MGVLKCLSLTTETERGGIGIDPGKTGRQKKGEYKSKREEGTRTRIMVAAVCESALTML